MECGDHLKIWLTATRHDDRQSVDYFTKHRTTTSCCRLLTRAIKLNSVPAVESLLEVGAALKGLAKHGAGLF